MCSREPSQLTPNPMMFLSLLLLFTQHIYVSIFTDSLFMMIVPSSSTSWINSVASTTIKSAFIGIVSKLLQHMQLGFLRVIPPFLRRRITLKITKLKWLELTEHSIPCTMIRERTVPWLLLGRQCCNGTCCQVRCLNNYTLRLQYFGSNKYVVIIVENVYS